MSRFIRRSLSANPTTMKCPDGWRLIVYASSWYSLNSSRVLWKREIIEHRSSPLSPIRGSGAPLVSSTYFYHSIWDTLLLAITDASYSLDFGYLRIVSSNEYGKLGDWSRNCSVMLKAQLHLDSQIRSMAQFFIFLAAPAATYKSKGVTSWGQSRLAHLREAMSGEGDQLGSCTWLGRWCRLKSRHPIWRAPRGKQQI